MIICGDTADQRNLQFNIDGESFVLHLENKKLSFSFFQEKIRLKVLKKQQKSFFETISDLFLAPKIKELHRKVWLFYLLQKIKKK